MVKGIRMHPNVQTSAPGIPANRMPTKVAELMEIGPGVISAMVIRSANSSRVSRCQTLTTWFWIRGIAA